MLVLSRKSNEKIHIDHNITLTVVEIKGNRVKIGIKAPDNCRILRAEVLENAATTQQPATAEREIELVVI
jgi:carbon storage regulator